MNVGVVGLGLIGGSIAKAFKYHTENIVYGYDLNDEAYKKALLVGAIDEKLDEKTVGNCDVVIVALYPNAAIEYISYHADRFKKGALVVDCCGVKEHVCKPCFELAKEHGFCFYGGHPMAGTQFSGFEYSRENLFGGASMIIVPPDNADKKELDYVGSIFKSIGFKAITVTDASTHDKMIAYTSQLAHVVSNAYVKSPSAKLHSGFSAGSFKDLTRVAKLNETMWTELFMENKEFLTHEIDTIAEELKKYSDAIKNDDSDTLCALLREGRIAKESTL